MKESKFSENFIDAMKVKFPFMWKIKIHGHEMQREGVPDHLFGINGKFLTIEFKIQRDGRISTSPLQLKEICDIKNSNSIALIVAYDENYDKILIREKRIDYKSIFLSPSNVNIKSGNLKIDWDFEFSQYENAIDLIGVMIGV